MARQGSCRSAHLWIAYQALNIQPFKPCLQVERQIDQMVRFIKQEAEEKANEINVSAEEVRTLLETWTSYARMLEVALQVPCIDEVGSWLGTGVQYSKAPAARRREGQDSKGV